MDIFYDISGASPPKSSTDSFDHLVDVRPLRFLAAMIGKLLGISFARPEQFRGDGVGDDLWAARRRVDGALSKAAIHNLKTRLKWAMLGSEAWRAKVIAGLGGAGRLARWEARQENYHARKSALVGAALTPSDYAPLDIDTLRRGEVEAAPVRKPVPTDETGWFRLSPIGRIMRPRAVLSETQAAEHKAALALRRSLRRALWDALPMLEKFGRPSMCRKEFLQDTGAPEDWVFEIMPIPVTPEELRGDLESDTQNTCHPAQSRRLLTRGLSLDDSGGEKVAEKVPP